MTVRFYFMATLLVIGFGMLPNMALAQQLDYYVCIKTNQGNMRFRLYNETPEHRKNFLKLVNEKHFDGTLIYRVIKNFVIQGGSSDSRNAPPGKHIGYGSTSQNITSEFKKTLFHKTGALCAPRQPENINHFRMSDISQFYIVHGRVYTPEQLDLLEKKVNNPILAELKRKYYLPHKDSLDLLKQTNPREFNRRLGEIRSKIDFEFTLSDRLVFSPEQREVYTTVGGCPDLDGEYTVFGEVTEGLDVIQRIANMATDKNDRPLKDVVVTIQECY
jgi:cyclophilin family peptidyl-prolyl cis-trans isomerase